VGINDSCCAESEEELKWNFVRDAHGCLQVPNRGFRPPTAEEVSRLPLGKLREMRTRPQDLHNNFAHLLNRGSSLE
jgi:hypothetical protein